MLAEKCWTTAEVQKLWQLHEEILRRREELGNAA
jgi:hypothetical protein